MLRSMIKIKNDLLQSNLLTLLYVHAQLYDTKNASQFINGIPT